MELREFVKVTLVQIIEGVQGAREAVAAMPAAQEGAEVAVGSTHRVVEFDVGVTVVEKADREGSGGVQISVLSIGGGISKGKEHTAVNHIKFSVPIALPQTKQAPAPPINYPKSGIA